MLKKTTHWLQVNLFFSITSSVFSLTIISLVIWLLYSFSQWAIIDATWIGQSRQDCNHGGACWAFVTARFSQFVYGFYPEHLRWRVDLSAIIFAFGCGLFIFSKLSLKIKSICTLLVLITVTTISIGGVFGLEYVPTNVWGGLFLTAFLAFGSIICAFPIALLLALGRNSKLEIIKSLCICLIEVIRGVPLITVLFMSSVMLPLFLPQRITLDELLRAFIGITFFQAAYLAEVIRGGLNGIDKGQYEAANSLGMSYWQSMYLIIVPQALRLMIPGIVNTFIALFKDTTLVLIIGLYDLLGIVQAALTDRNWMGSDVEAYLFCAAFYWVFCFSMSLYSKRLERRLVVRR